MVIKPKRPCGCKKKLLYVKTGKGLQIAGSLSLPGGGLGLAGRGTRLAGRGTRLAGRGKKKARSGRQAR